MTTELTEDNQYSRFDFRNFGNVHVVVFYSQSLPTFYKFVDLIQTLEYAIKPTIALAYADVDQYPSAVEQFKVVFDSCQ